MLFSQGTHSVQHIFLIFTSECYMYSPRKNFKNNSLLIKIFVCFFWSIVSQNLFLPFLGRSFQTNSDTLNKIQTHIYKKHQNYNFGWEKHPKNQTHFELLGQLPDTVKKRAFGHSVHCTREIGANFPEDFPLFKQVTICTK